MFANPSNQPVAYLFIDGAYLAAFAKSAGELWYGAAAEIDHRILGANFRKVFYYDCLPVKTDKETNEDFEFRRNEKENFFDSLRAIDGWHVSEGLAKWKKKGGTRQKEIDISIAVEMLTHTYRKNMDQLTFVAGDQDFRPLLEAVVREGMYVTLKYGASSISRELMHAADAKQAIGYYDLYNLCTRDFKTNHPLPTHMATSENQLSHAKILEISHINGKEVGWLYKSDFDHIGYILHAATGLPLPDHPFIEYQSQDIQLLKKTVKFCHGINEWMSRAISVAL